MLVLFYGLASLPLVSAADSSVAQTKQVREYVQAWSAECQRSLQVDTVTAWAAEAAKGANEYDRALVAIESLTGLSQLDFAAGRKGLSEAEQRKESLARMRHYAASLEKALKVEVPLVLEAGGDNFSRAGAVRFLGFETGHHAFLPLLKAVAYNEAEAPSVRLAAFQSISFIPQADVVPLYIGLLYDPKRAQGDPEFDRAVTLLACQVLERLSQFRALLHGSAPELQAQWQRWWEENGSSWTYPPREYLGVTFS
jgi:hypothetical protein